MSLNPVFSVGDQIAEQVSSTRGEARRRGTSHQALTLVGIESS
jgi:ABC-type dipeptide/oligopeptide/nickel transport system ATPase component